MLELTCGCGKTIKVSDEGAACHVGWACVRITFDDSKWMCSTCQLTVPVVPPRTRALLLGDEYIGLAGQRVEAIQLRENNHTAILHFNDPGIEANAVASEKSFEYWRVGDWFVRNEEGKLAGLSDSEFRENFRPMKPGAWSRAGGDDGGNQQRGRVTNGGGGAGDAGVGDVGPKNGRETRWVGGQWSGEHTASSSQTSQDFSGACRHV